MSRAQIKIDMKALKKLEDRLTGTIDTGTLGQIGERIREEMLDDVSKGISPIKGQGRFPAYKWAGKANELKKEINKLKRQRNSFFRTKGSKAKLTNQIISKTYEKLDIEEGRGGFMNKGRYPFTAEAKKEGKKPRPVNLELTGDFLKSLLVWFSGTGKTKAVHIGFKDDLSKKKEQGHREGANGQPKRPMIPQGNETLTPKYALLIRQILAQTLRIKLR